MPEMSTGIAQHLGSEEQRTRNIGSGLRSSGSAHSKPRWVVSAEGAASAVFPGVMAWFSVGVGLW